MDLKGDKNSTKTVNSPQLFNETFSIETMTQSLLYNI